MHASGTAPKKSLGPNQPFRLNRPPRSGLQMPGRSPYNIGHDDLNPPGLGTHDPLRGSFTGGVLPRPGGGSGMHPTFDDPLFGGTTWSAMGSYWPWRRKRKQSIWRRHHLSVVKEVHIEFTEPQILVILGKSERSYTSGNHSAGLIEGPSMHGAIKDDGDDHNKSQPQRPEKSDKHDDKTKYWFAERSVREFSRTFSFLSYVDQDSVSVSFQARFLSIIVPKIRSMSPVASMLTARMYDGNKYGVVVEPSPIAS
ncbi:hypothetical protein QL093DRAFT_2565252 [Fusarium oxysporum]|nr:hypothetical protein QL093DRAFT_2565252 [Fusarium oxysporum]